jgi:hypothetical protein
MESNEVPGAKIPAPPMTEEDIFGSTPAAGSISYRLPSPAKLFNMPDSNFDHYSTMTFWISIVTKNLDDDKVEM